MTDLARLSVLVVDDDAASRDLLAEALESLGARVRIAASARDARTLMRHALPDVIVSDVGMPIEDGCEFIRTMRTLAREAGGEVPAIAFTASLDPATRERALACGFDAVVTKPLDLRVLAGVIAQVAETVERVPVGTAGPVARDS